MSTVAGLAILALGFFMLQALALNIAMLSLGSTSLRSPSLPSTAAQPTGLVVAGRILASLPSSAYTQDQMLWITARAARQMERLGESASAVGCDWNPPLCQYLDGRLTLTPAGHLRLAAAYTAGNIAPSTLPEKELIALSCLRATASMPSDAAGQACLQQLAGAWPDIAPLANRQGLYVASSIPELTTLSAADLDRLLVGGAITCGDARDFLRGWVNQQGLAALVFDDLQHLSAQCAGDPELQFYYGRAADLAGYSDEARAAYQLAMPQEHPEVAFWQLDLLGRTGNCSAAIANAQAFVQRQPGAQGGLHLSQGLANCCATDEACARDTVLAAPCARRPLIFEAETLRSGFVESGQLLTDNIYPDETASAGLARRSQRINTFVAYGPYIPLPYGRYRVTAYVRSESAAPTRKAFRFDVRSDAVGWRSQMWEAEVSSSPLDQAGYQAFTHEFVHNGEGNVSAAILTTSDSPLWVDRIEIVDVSCE